MTPAHEDHSAAADMADSPAASAPAAQHARSSDWSNLTATLTRELEERISGVGGDPKQFQRTWTDLVQAYGPRGAHDVVRLRAGELLNVELDPDVAEKLAHLAYSRENFGSRPGTAQVIPGLPQEGVEYRAAAGFDMPPQVRVRVQAASDAMRRELGRIYENPVAAEARLHVIAVSERDPVAFTAAIERNPERLGGLRQDLATGGHPVAAPAMAHARVAYAFHFSPTADHAADLMSREAVIAIQRAAAEVERAAAALDRAIDLHGPALSEHLQVRRGQILARPEPARSPSRGAEWLEPEHAEGPIDRGEALAQQPQIADRHSGPPAAVDPAVEEAFRAHDALEEARLLELRGAELRGQRGDAQSILAVLDYDDRELLRTRRDVDALALKVYRHPDRAVERWNALVNKLGGDTERAEKIVRANPGRLGALHSEPAGWLARLPMPGWLADNIPFRSTAEAREHVPRFAERAAAYSDARRQAEAPVEWTTPTGQRLRDRAEVRAAAREVDTRLGTEIGRNDAALLARGNVRGAELQAQRALSALGPEQRSVLAQRLAAAKGVPAAEMAAALSRLATAPRVVAQGARLLRVAGEGPSQSL